MAIRKNTLTEGEFYHIYNRGVDKRSVFSENYDFDRFIQSMNEFNSEDPIGSIYENSFRKSKDQNFPLVNIICYCLNPNHYHFLLEQVAEHGIEKFMHKLSTGYTNYFNKKYQRSGALFQGRYKSKFIDSNEYLLHVGSYINLNHKVHKLGSSTPKSSWLEYTNKEIQGFCKKDIILDQFVNTKEYEQFAYDSLRFTLEQRDKNPEFEKLLLE